MGRHGQNLTAANRGAAREVTEDRGARASGAYRRGVRRSAAVGLNDGARYRESAGPRTAAGGWRTAACAAIVLASGRNAAGSSAARDFGG